MQILLLASFALLCPQFSPLSARASTEPADSEVFCGVGHGAWRTERTRPAAKRPANLNVGEPRAVRMIYFLPNDRPFRQEVVDSMKSRILEAQSFFAGQMDAHDYGKTTFRIETEPQGEPLVHRVNGQHPGRHYHEPLIIRDEIRMFDFQENIYFIVVDAGFSQIGGVGSRYNKKAGFALVSPSVNFIVVAHELGHAFGLDHDYRDDAYIRSYGPGQNRLSACAAEFLYAHPYFNPESPIDETPLPTIELVSPRAYPEGSESVSTRLDVGDSKGLHQVILYASSRELFVGARGFPEVKACRGLSGERDAVVEFRYDGIIPSSSSSSLSDPAVHPIRVKVVDIEGDESWKDFILAATSTHHICASTTLTLGRQPGTNTVVATVANLEPVTFNATGKAHADFDGDGTVGFSDFVQFAGKFGLSQGDQGYDARFDLDGNGLIGFSDFLIFAAAFGNSTA